MLRTPFHFPQVLAPGGAVPDLQVVVDAGDDDLAVEAGGSREAGWNLHPPLFVDGGRRRREEVALHQPTLAAEWVERREPCLDETIPVGPGVRVEAAVHAPREHDPFREGLSELGRKGEAALVLDRVLVLAGGHPAG